jgi:hypothetical protein
MKKVIGLIALFGIAVGNAHTQMKPERIEFDTIIDGGHFHFYMNQTQIEYPNSRNSKNHFGNVIVNSAEEERKRVEKELRAIEEYIDSMRIVLFTNTIELTKSEAEVFWPAYENYRTQLNKIAERRSEANAKLCDPFKKYKIREYLAYVDIEVNSYKEEALLRRQYAEKFKTILGDKFYLLYRAEHLFIRWIYSNF